MGFLEEEPESLLSHIMSDDELRDEIYRRLLDARREGKHWITEVEIIEEMEREIIDGWWQKFSTIAKVGLFLLIGGGLAFLLVR